MAFLLAFKLRRYIVSTTVRNYCHRNYTKTPLIYSEEVLHAKTENKPIVALESTIITHGMPYPKNLTTALEVENIIRQKGATPATIAILKGQLTIGLTEEQLQYLAQAKGVVKASRRDLAPVIAAKCDGATTVAGTIIASELGDIDVFVTGGIGGVHRGGEHTLDISADLTELGRSRTLVVSSGVKSILDIGKTLEYLETQGVTICTFGDSLDFPAFYTVRSGHLAPYRVSDALQAANVLYASRQLNLQSGIVIAVPVPLENAMEEKVIEDAIQAALLDAKKNGIHGKEITPFLLSAVAKDTGGASLDTNIALIKNNAKVGADIAVEYQKLKNLNNVQNFPYIGTSKPFGSRSPNSSRQFHTDCNNFKEASLDFKDRSNMKEYINDPVLVIGGANLDRTYRVTEEHVQLDGSTHACTTEQCGGGVARNMAEALWRLRGGGVRLLTAVGDDADGRYLTDIVPGLLLDGCIIKDARTSMYAVLFDSKGECLLGMGDMNIHDHITPELVNKHMNTLENAPLVILDGNVPQNTLNYVLELCHQLQKPVFYEPTDKRKAVKALKMNSYKYKIMYASPNISELRSMANYLEPNIFIDKTSDVNEIIMLSKIVTRYVNVLIVTMGNKGVTTIRRFINENKKSNKEYLKINYYAIKKLNNIENVSGAGDCFNSGYVYGILLGFPEAFCVSLGFETAKSALLCKTTVPSYFEIPSNLTASAHEMWVSKLDDNLL